MLLAGLGIAISAFLVFTCPLADGIFFSALVRGRMPSFGARIVTMLGVASVSFREQLWPFRLKSFANLQD